MDVFDVRENAERGEDNSDDCKIFEWKLDGDSFELICSDLIVDDDGDKIKCEFDCFVWSIRILLVIFAPPLPRKDVGEYISCLHVVGLIINDGNGWESVVEDNSSVLIRKPEVAVEEIESDDSKMKIKKRIIFFPFTPGNGNMS